MHFNKIEWFIFTCWSCGLLIYVYNWRTQPINLNQKIMGLGFAGEFAGFLLQRAGEEMVGSIIMIVGAIVMIYFGIRNVSQARVIKSPHKRI